MQVCTCPDIAYKVYTYPDIAYIIRMLGKCNQKAVIRVIWCVQKMKDYMLAYRRSEQIEIIRYANSNFIGCQDGMKTTLGYIYLLVGGFIS